MKNKFIFEESDDPLLYDDQYTLEANKNIYIQVSNKFIVHRWVDEEEASYNIGSFSTLKDAMTQALDIQAQINAT